ncbi:AbrB/MazE/SpoVT family DNA-binding domain-containing protein [Rhodopila sp.]|uniref:AbrB/MazE/SpoVT family DNA-binding domain-containing protein n=1 Tax=Rhodopila sp. TaxID=2480087 RepID=UPI003D10BDBE
MDKTVILTVTAKGQVTLKRELLDHLGVRPGDQIAVDLCASRGASIKAASRAGIEPFFGCLPDKGRSVPIDEMGKAIEDGWAGKGQ